MRAATLLFFAAMTYMIGTIGLGSTLVPLSRFHADLFGIIIVFGPLFFLAFGIFEAAMAGIRAGRELER